MEQIFKIMSSLKFDMFKHYGVDKILVNSGLVVVKKYRGRAISEHLTRAVITFCRTLDVKVIQIRTTNPIIRSSLAKTGHQHNMSMR